MINKVIKAMCAATAIISIVTPIKANGAAEIKFNGNNIVVNATDIKEGETVLWSYGRYTDSLPEGSAIIYENDIWSFKMLHQIDNISFTLNPTGRFRENTEVIIFGQYFLMAEPDNPLSSIRGDVNGDGNHNIADLVLIDKFVHGDVQPTYIEAGRADLTKDNFVDSFDLVMIRQLIVDAGKNDTSI